MRRVFVGLAVIGLLAIGAMPVGAHHAFSSEFDNTKPINFMATVTGMDWVNPHSWIHLDVKKPDGTVEKWMIEGSTPNSLYRRGLTKRDLAVGTEVKVTGFQAKDGGNRASGGRIDFGNGRSIFLGADNRAAEGAPAAPAEPAAAQPRR